MLQYRVTKYDPAHRDPSGAYLLEEWTSYLDIGRTFNGVPLTSGAYQTVEDAYVAVAEAFVQEAGIAKLGVVGLESSDGKAPVSEGEFLSASQIGSVLRAVLREKFWCRLEGMGAFIHVGYDYYMYVGVSRECPRAEASAKAHKLYIENFLSPYAQNPA